MSVLAPFLAYLEPVEKRNESERYGFVERRVRGKDGGEEGDIGLYSMRNLAFLTAAACLSCLVCGLATILH